MTDISDWPDLIQVVKLRYKSVLNDEWQDLPDGTPVFQEYVQIPLNEYQIGNILEMLDNAEDTGDWYLELLSILIVAMDKAGIKEVKSNKGRFFRIDDLRKGIIGTEE